MGVRSKVKLRLNFYFYSRPQAQAHRTRILIGSKLCLRGADSKFLEYYCQQTSQIAKEGNNLLSFEMNAKFKKTVLNGKLPKLLILLELLHSGLPTIHFESIHSSTVYELIEQADSTQTLRRISNKIKSAWPIDFVLNAVVPFEITTDLKFRNNPTFPTPSALHSTIHTCPRCRVLLSQTFAHFLPPECCISSCQTREYRSIRCSVFC